MKNENIKRMSDKSIKFKDIAINCFNYSDIHTSYKMLLYLYFSGLPRMLNQ